MHRKVIGSYRVTGMSLKTGNRKCSSALKFKKKLLLIVVR